MLEAASDVGVGLALKGAPGFVGPGFGVAPDMCDRDLCRARFSARSPTGLRRCLVRRPLLASGGATPVSETKGAPLLTRAAWDQLIGG